MQIIPLSLLIWMGSSDAELSLILRITRFGMKVAEH
jgi:hypothetical protein